MFSITRVMCIVYRYTIYIYNIICIILYYALGKQNTFTTYLELILTQFHGGENMNDGRIRIGTYNTPPPKSNNSQKCAYRQKYILL